MNDMILRASGMAIEISGMELVTRVDLEVGRGRRLGLVGETGSGKTLTCRALVGTLSTIGGEIVRGQLELQGRDLRALGDAGWRGLHGRVIGFVPQNSQSSLNPLMRVGTHVIEVLELLSGAEGRTARRRAVELLSRVGLPDPERVMRLYPHQLSGGMRQRVMIALAIAGNPALLVADEPTTALDVTVQQSILKLLSELARNQAMSIVLVSHDLAIVGAATDDIAVMYGGCVIESGPTQQILGKPLHPYTQALLAARPSLGSTTRLAGIPGTPISPDRWPDGCRFAPRCRRATNLCRAVFPETTDNGRGGSVACHYWAETIEPDSS